MHISPITRADRRPLGWHPASAAALPAVQPISRAELRKLVAQMID